VNSNRGTTRVQLELPQKSMDRLRKLKDITEAGSYAEVLKNALRLYEAVISEVNQGNEIMIKDKSGEVRPYPVFSA
jgi:hypothetical protein